MRRRDVLHPVLQAVGVAVGATILWLAVAIPSGFALSELAVFAGPGLVLAIAWSWASHAFSQKQWRWTSALSAAAIGAIIFPPIVAFFLAWSGTLGPTSMIAVLVFSTWAVLIVGLTVGVGRRLLHHPRKQRLPSRRTRSLRISR